MIYRCGFMLKSRQLMVGSTHWGRVTHICVSKILTISSNNGLSPGRRQAIIWNDAGILGIGRLGINFSGILIEINILSCKKYYDDVKMGAIASQITSLTIVYSFVYSDADQRKHQSSASLAFVWGIHRGPVNSPHKWSVTRQMFPFDDVIYFISASMSQCISCDKMAATLQLVV